MSKIVTLKITMDRIHWAEIANALESKIRLIERGDYGEDDVGGNKKWIADLEVALKNVSDALAKKGLHW